MRIQKIQEPERDDVGVVELLEDPELPALLLLHRHRLHGQPGGWPDAAAGSLNTLTMHRTHSLESD